MIGDYLYVIGRDIRSRINQVGQFPLQPGLEERQWRTKTVENAQFHYFHTNITTCDVVFLIGGANDSREGSNHVQLLCFNKGSPSASVSVVVGVVRFVRARQ